MLPHLHVQYRVRARTCSTAKANHIEPLVPGRAGEGEGGGPVARPRILHLFFQVFSKCRLPKEGACPHSGLAIETIHPSVAQSKRSGSSKVACLMDHIDGTGETDQEIGLVWMYVLCSNAFPIPHPLPLPLLLFFLLLIPPSSSSSCSGSFPLT